MTHQFLPGGQITSDFQKLCQAPESKIFRFSPNPNHRYISPIPSRSEGRIMIAMTVGWDAVDAEVPITNGADAYGKVVWS